MMQPHIPDHHQPILFNEPDDPDLGAAGRRLRHAFPLLAALLSAISAGIPKGMSFEHILSEFADRQTRKRLHLLVQEVEDFFVIGSTDEDHFDLLVTDGLGLGEDILWELFGNGWEFFCLLQSTLQDDYHLRPTTR